MRRSEPLLSQTAVSEKVGLLRGQHVYAVSDHSDHPRATPQKHGAASGPRCGGFPQDIDSRRFYLGSAPAAESTGRVRPVLVFPWTLNTLYYIRQESAFRGVKGGVGVTSSRGRQTSPGPSGFHPAAAEFHIYQYLSAETVSVLYMKTERS